MKYDRNSIARSVLGTGLSTAATGATIGGPVGGAVGLVVGGVAGAIGDTKRQREEEQVAQKQKQIQDSIRLASYPTSGVTSGTTYYRYGGVKYYANGGVRVKMANGGVIGIGSSGGIAKGPSHAKGGVDLPGNVEVEGEETVHDDGTKEVWYSNRLKTKSGVKFSDAAESLLYKKEELESKLNSRSRATRNTALREIEKINMKLDELASEQMEIQKSKGIPTDGQVDGVGVRRAANGASFSRIAPYLDNIANVGVTLATPKVPKPELEQKVDMDTEYNVHDIVGAERRGMSSLRRGIERNVSSSAVGRANMLAAQAGSQERINRIMGDKERIETRLTNQEILNNQGVAQRNLDRTNQYRSQVAVRRDEQLSNLSATAANAVDDFVTQEMEDRLRRRDTASLELLKAKYKSLGIWNRTMEKGLVDYMAGKIDYNTFKGIQNMKKMPKLSKLPTRASGVIGSPRPLNQ